MYLLRGFKILVGYCDNFDIKKSGDRFIIHAKSEKFNLDRTCSVGSNNNQVILGCNNKEIRLD